MPKQWKMERASVSRLQKKRPKSNKFSRSDTSDKPMAHGRRRVWIGGHTRSGGVKVKGHFRSTQA
jgi:hypothetical protein